MWFLQPKLLALLPSLASHSVMIPLIIQTILPMLQKDGKPYVLYNSWCLSFLLSFLFSAFFVYEEFHWAVLVILCIVVIIAMPWRDGRYMLRTIITFFLRWNRIVRKGRNNSHVHSCPRIYRTCQLELSF